MNQRIELLILFVILGHFFNQNHDFKSIHSTGNFYKFKTVLVISIDAM